MTTHLQTQIIHFMDEFRLLVTQIESGRVAQEQKVLIRTRIDALANMSSTLKATIKSKRDRETERVLDALNRCQTALTNIRMSNQWISELGRLSTALADRYEYLLHALRSAPMFETIARPMRTLRPTNYWRNLFHAGMGISGAFVYEFLTVTQMATLLTLGSLLAIYVFLDQIRRIDPRFNEIVYGKIFGLIARPREQYQTPSGIWYVVGLIIAVAIADKTHAQLASLVLGVADPAASLIGKKWGKRKIFRDRSWVGTLAFTIVGFVAASVFLFSFRSWTVSTVLLTACIAALSGAVAEMLGGDHLDDNLAIPLGVSASLTLMAWIAM